MHIFVVSYDIFVVSYDIFVVSYDIFVVSYDRLTKSSNEMSTKTSRILVLVSIVWSNFRHSFSFVDENQRRFSYSFCQHVKN